MKALWTIYFFFLFLLSLPLFHSPILSLSLLFTFIQQVLANHVLARLRPNFDLKFLHGFIQKYMYTYAVGVYVTLHPYNIYIRWMQAELHQRAGFNKPCTYVRMRKRIAISF